MMLAEIAPEVQVMLPKLTVCTISLLLAIAAAILIGIVFDEWMHIRAIEKDVKSRREQIEKLIAAQNDAQRQLLSERSIKQKKGLRKLLPVSGCLWHNS